MLSPLFVTITLSDQPADRYRYGPFTERLSVYPPPLPAPCQKQKAWSGSENLDV